MSNDYTGLTKKRINWIKKIKLNHKLPCDYIELIKKRSNWIKIIKSNQKLQWLNFATNGQP